KSLQLWRCVRGHLLIRWFIFGMITLVDSEAAMQWGVNRAATAPCTIATERQLERSQFLTPILEFQVWRGDVIHPGSMPLRDDEVVLLQQPEQLLRRNAIQSQPEDRFGKHSPGLRPAQQMGPGLAAAEIVATRAVVGSARRVGLGGPIEGGLSKLGR